MSNTVLGVLIQHKFLSMYMADIIMPLFTEVGILDLVLHGVTLTTGADIIHIMDMDGAILTRIQCMVMVDTMDTVGITDIVGIMDTVDIMDMPITEDEAITTIQEQEVITEGGATTIMQVEELIITIEEEITTVQI